MPNTDEWNQALKNQYSIEQLKSMFKITEENENKYLQELNGI